MTRIPGKIAVSLLAALMLIPAQSMADSVELKDGRILHGLVLDRSEATLTFQLSSGLILHIMPRDILRLSYRLSGLPLCYRRKAETQTTCTSLLRRWDRKDLHVVLAPEYRELAVIPVDDLVEMEVLVGEKQNAMDYLGKMDIPGEVELRSQKILKGRIRQEGSGITVSDYKSSVLLPPDSIARITMKDSETLLRMALKDFYPGYHRWSEDGSLLGLGTMTLFSVSTVSSLAFWQASVHESRIGTRDQSTILYGNRVHLNRYQSLRRNMSGAGFLATGLFAINAVDVLLIRSRRVVGAERIGYAVSCSVGLAELPAEGAVIHEGRLNMGLAVSY